MAKCKTGDAGAASIIIELEDGEISVEHGSKEGLILGRTKTTKDGDWERLIAFLRSELGIIWEVS